MLESFWVGPIVASGEFRGKAVALLNTSPRATHAPAQLAEILVTMAARLIPEASVTPGVPAARKAVAPTRRRRARTEVTVVTE